jgi:serine/threonine-protein kinase
VTDGPVTDEKTTLRDLRASPLHELEPGTVLAARYRIVGPVGAGGMGAVYEAEQIELQRRVAIKLVLNSEGESFERLRREALGASAVQSPHVVSVFDFHWEEGEPPFLVMELLAGRSLASLMEAEGALPFGHACRLACQVLDGLGAAHRVGLVHRDVKPANIFLVAQPDGRTLVKLLDFGIAAETDSCGSAKNELIGTPEYIAPEVLFGKQHIDARADLYALGVVAFECLTGRCPFPGGTIDDVFLGIARGARVSLSDLRPELDNDEIEEWMGRALHPDAFWRFSSAKDLVEGMVAAVRSSRRPAMPMLRSAA